MPIGTEVDLDPGDTVLDGDPASPRGAQHPTILAHVLWPNGFVDQDTTWYRGRPWPRAQCYMGT